MESDSPPGRNASHPNAEIEADPNPDILASKSELESEQKMKTAGVAVGNMENSDANREDVDRARAYRPSRRNKDIKKKVPNSNADGSNNAVPLMAMSGEFCT
jgi:hypothetical protein